LAARIESGDVIVVDAIQFGAPKTKEAFELLKNVGADEAKRVLVILPQHDDNCWLSFRNLPNVKVRTAPSKGDGKGAAVGFSARDLLVAHKIVIARDALDAIQEAWT
jgi:large subunit ribosomal protein L4